MKIGLDIHGVINKNPKKFVDLALKFRARGDLIYIITGETLSNDLINELLSYNNNERFWDELVSIQDNLLSFIVPTGTDKKGRPVFDDYRWDSFKGKFCDELDIDLMIDDTKRYGKYFNKAKTIFAVYDYNE